jgi:hypothetical protein
MFMDTIRAILVFLYDFMFGCGHEHVTRPFTLNRRTYKVCLDCGKQIYYSPVTMRQLTAREVRRMLAGDVHVMTPSIAGASGQTLMSSPTRKSNAA